MGLTSHPVLLCLFCVSLVSLATGKHNNEDHNEMSGKCHGWEVDLRLNLSDSGNISECLRDLGDKLNLLSPGCVKSFSLNITLSNLKYLMKALVERYDDLIPGTRKQVYNWVKSIYQEENGPSRPVEHGKPEETDKSKKNKDKGQGGKDKGNWITLEVLLLLDRFIIQAPSSTLKGLGGDHNSTICQFFNSSSDLLDRLHHLTPVQAQILLKGLNQCTNVDIKDPKFFDRLGQLVCFYPKKDLKSPNDNFMFALVKSLENCSNNVQGILQRLVKDTNVETLTPEKIDKLGEALTELTVSQVSSMSNDTVNQTVLSLGKIKKWSRGQRKILIRKIKSLHDTFTAKDLKQLNSLMAGLNTMDFEKMNGSELLDTMEDKAVAESSKELESLQKRSIVNSILRSVKVSSALQKLPESLISEVPLNELQNAGDDVVTLDFLSQSKPWKTGQAIALIGHIKDKLNNTENIGKLKDAVKGIGCKLISSLKAEVVRSLARNPRAMAEQIRCSAARFFKVQKSANPDYFSSLTADKIEQLPAPYLLFEPSIDDLNLIPQALCSNVLELLSQTNITVLPRVAARRTALLGYAKDCLKMTASSLTEDQGNSLGPLVCAFSADEVKNINDAVFPEIMDQLRQCGRFEGKKKEALRNKIISIYSSPADWTVDTLSQLGSLLEVLNKDDIKLIPNNEYTTAVFQQLLDSHTPPQGFIISDFNNTADFSLLYEKFFILQKDSQDSKRRRRETECAYRPTVEQILNLGQSNSFWTAEQLACMKPQTFIDSVEMLTDIPTLSDEQLKALKSIAVKAYGSSLTNDQLASLKKITLFFTEDEVKQHFKNIDTDTIGAISEYKEWATDNYSSRAKFIVEELLAGQGVETLSSTQLSSLGYFICTLNLTQIRKINVTSFRSSARDIGENMCPNVITLSALKDKAVEAFIPVKEWTGAELQEIGTIAAGVSAEEMAELSTSSVMFLTLQSIVLMPPKVLSAMSVEQIKNLGVRNSASVTAAQKRALSSNQLKALNENIQIKGGAGSVQPLLATLFALVLTGVFY
eukprot:gi/632956982/ref/XP_007894232.1/ PREDICTED: otoancorin-like [Callorhinchus milii]